MTQPHSMRCRSDVCAVAPGLSVCIRWPVCLYQVPIPRLMRCAIQVRVKGDTLLGYSKSDDRELKLNPEDKEEVTLKYTREEEVLTCSSCYIRSLYARSMFWIVAAPISQAWQFSPTRWIMAVVPCTGDTVVYQLSSYRGLPRHGSTMIVLMLDNRGLMQT